MTAAAVADQVLRLADGRALGFRVYGDPAGAPLLFLHGTPGSRLEFAIGHDAGRELGLALVAPDRWGYGLSDVPETPSLPAFAADMAALMDHLGHRRFAVGGISGGGPYAAAVAACLASRVTALALVSPVGPIADPAVPPSLSRFHRFCFTVLPRSAARDRRHLRRLPLEPRAVAASRRPARNLARRRARQGADRAARRSRAAARQLPRGSAARHARADHATGAVLAALGRRSRRHLARRRGCGSAPPTRPCRCSRRARWRSAIAGCAFEELPGEGHLWVAANYRRVLEWIAHTRSRARRAIVQ